MQKYEIICYLYSSPNHLTKNSLQEYAKETIDQSYWRIQCFRYNKAKLVTSEYQRKCLRGEVIGVTLFPKEVKNETLPTTDIIVNKRKIDTDTG